MKKSNYFLTMSAVTGSPLGANQIFLDLDFFFFTFLLLLLLLQPSLMLNKLPISTRTHKRELKLT